MNDQTNKTHEEEEEPVSKLTGFAIALEAPNHWIMFLGKLGCYGLAAGLGVLGVDTISKKIKARRQERGNLHSITGSK